MKNRFKEYKVREKKKVIFSLNKDQKKILIHVLKCKKNGSLFRN